MALKGKKGNVPAVVDDPKALALAEADAFADTDAAGDDMSREDYAIPRLFILQSNSPQCTKGDPLRVENAEPGDIYDVVNGKLYSGEEGVVVVPLNFRKTYIEWVTREAGGGFVADHGAISGADLLKTTSKDDKGRDILPSGNQLVRTMEYVVYQLTDEAFNPCIISMASTQIKYALRLNTQLSQATLIDLKTKKPRPAPIFYRAWQFRTQPEKNDKGSWYSWLITPSVKLSEMKYKWLGDKWGDFAAECQQFRNLVKSESLRFAPPPPQGGGAEADGEAM